MTARFDLLLRRPRKRSDLDIAQRMNHLADEDDEGDDGLRDAYVRTAALSMIKEIREKGDQEATALVEKWFALHRVAIKSLPDVRQQDYEEIRAMTIAPQRGELSTPRSRMEDFKIIDANDQLADAPLVGTAPDVRRGRDVSVVLTEYLGA